MKVIQQRSSVSFPMEGQTARKVRLQGRSDNKEVQESKEDQECQTTRNVRRSDIKEGQTARQSDSKDGLTARSVRQQGRSEN